MCEKTKTLFVLADHVERATYENLSRLLRPWHVNTISIYDLDTASMQPIQVEAWQQRQLKGHYGNLLLSPLSYLDTTDLRHQTIQRQLGYAATLRKPVYAIGTPDMIAKATMLLIERSRGKCFWSLDEFIEAFAPGHR